jgi:hypothetical protein
MGRDEGNEGEERKDVCIGMQILEENPSSLVLSVMLW